MRKLTLDVDEIYKWGKLVFEDGIYEYYMFRGYGVFIDTKEGEVLFANEGVNEYFGVKRYVYVKSVKWAISLIAMEKSKYIGTQEEIKEVWENTSPEVARLITDKCKAL